MNIAIAKRAATIIITTIVTTVIVVAILDDPTAITLGAIVLCTVISTSSLFRNSENDTITIYYFKY